VDATSIPQGVGPGFREMLECLYTQIEAYALREDVHLRMIDAAHHTMKIIASSAPDQGKMLEALQKDLAAVCDRVTQLEQARAAPPADQAPTSRPFARPPGEPSPLHAKILEALASQPAGLTRAQIEAAVGQQPLDGVLNGLCRRKRISRLGKGVFALPPGHTETGRPAKEMSYGQTVSQ
jgi:hypothetical protein